MAQYRFNCDEDEKARWVRAANKDGAQPLASWIRSRLNRAAATELGDTHSQKPSGKRPRR